MLHGRAEEAAELEATGAATAGPDAAANVARTRAAQVATHHSAFLRVRSLIRTNLRLGWWECTDDRLSAYVVLALTSDGYHCVDRAENAVKGRGNHRARSRAWLN